MCELLAILAKWQTLVGAFLGGVFSLGVALLVAYVARRREDVASSMVVVANLVEMKARFTSTRQIAAKQSVPEADFHKWLSEKLVQSRPKLTPSFDAAMARLMALDAHLASHLTFFHIAYRELDEKIDRVADDFQSVREKGTAARSVAAMQADARLLAQHLERAADHAECAAELINALFLSRYRQWTKLKRIFHVSAKEKDCLARLS